MNLKPLAFLFVRFSGLSVLFYAITEATYIPYYVRMVTFAEREEPFYSEAMSDLKMVMLRIFLQVAFGCILLAKTKRVIDFLLVDLTEKQKEEKLIQDEEKH